MSLAAALMTARVSVVGGHPSRAVNLGKAGA